MAVSIQKGMVFKSLNNISVVIDKKLGEGGQGHVYKIDYNGQPMALKIYKPASLHDPKAFYQNLENNVKLGEPNASFLWPRDILPMVGDTFGYIMALRSPEYVEMGYFMNPRKNVHFVSPQAAITAALEIVEAFQALHSCGYCFPDISYDNFFIDPQTGSVKICDNDNVTVEGKNMGILGTPQYMAPEIVRGEAFPSAYTDRFSLAVVIFILLTMTHPLEGRRYLCELLTPENELRIYGTDPVFIMDPVDRRNAPLENVHKNLAIVWPRFPEYLKEFFQQQFSKEIMANPQQRATEKQWKDILTRYCSELTCDT